MKFALKILSAGIGFGTIVGAGYALNHFLSDNTISKSLKDKGYTLLNFVTEEEDDKELWNPVVKAYSNSKKKINNLKISAIGNEATPTKENVNALKKECEKIIKLNKENKNNLELAERFCVTPITIKSLLEKSRNVLDSNPDTDLFPNHWDDKVNKYFQRNAKSKITATTLTQLDNLNKKTNRDKLKADCKKIEEKKSYDETFLESYSQFREWCTLPK